MDMDGMDMSGMDMGGTSGGGVSMMSMMIPWLHIGGSDDTLLFESWQPKTPGALAGACIGLAVVCLLERYLSGVRSVLEAHWRQRALAVTTNKRDSARASTPSSENCCGSEESEEPKKISRSVPATRVIAPFIASHDIPRGFLYAIQALLGYVLMLAVMCVIVD
ncbi:hypothetical protein VNI00_001891 [Paramarasmius palmivorus]|uniref:Copper transport protein n=1 Tax=Paramarasmius palmivorus TaxID=297713 RepID=A0AAW0E1X7_9AGAR